MARVIYYVNQRTGAIQATAPASKHHQRLSRLKEWEPLAVTQPVAAPDEQEPEAARETVAPLATEEETGAVLDLADEQIAALTVSQLKDLAVSLGLDTGFRKKVDLQAAVKARLTGLRGGSDG